MKWIKNKMKIILILIQIMMIKYKIKNQIKKDFLESKIIF